MQFEKEDYNRVIEFPSPAICFLSLGVSWNTTTAGSGANPAELKTLTSEKNYFWIYDSCWSYIMASLSWTVGARGRHFGFLLLWNFGSCSTLGPKPSPGN